MHNRYNRLKIKLANIGSVILIAIIPFGGPSEWLNPKNAQSLIFIPLLLLCFIAAWEFTNKITRSDLLLVRRYLRIHIIGISLKKSGIAIKLISVSYALMLVHQHFSKHEYIFICLSLFAFTIALLVFINENSANWFPNHKFIFNLMFTIFSAVVVYISSVYSASQINNIFSIRPDVLSNTMKVLTFYNIVKVVMPVIAIVVFLSLLVDQLLRLNLMPEKPKLYTLVFMMFILAMDMNSEVNTIIFVEKTALYADFNGKNNCSNRNLMSEVSIVYLDENLEYVLAAFKDKDSYKYKTLKCL